VHSVLSGLCALTCPLLSRALLSSLCSRLSTDSRLSALDSLFSTLCSRLFSLDALPCISVFAGSPCSSCAFRSSCATDHCCQVIAGRCFCIVVCFAHWALCPISPLLPSALWLFVRVLRTLCSLCFYVLAVLAALTPYEQPVRSTTKCGLQANNQQQCNSSATANVITNDCIASVSN
jgi:hypothetical protein